MMKPIVRTQGGFSLMEVMVAAGILAVGLLGLSGMQIISLNKNVDANDLTVASNLASEMMERIQFNRGRATGTTNPYNNIDTTMAGTAPSAAETQANGDYVQWRTALTASGLRNARGVVTLQPIVTNPPLNQFQVQVQVNWQEKTGTNLNRAVNVISVIAVE